MNSWFKISDLPSPEDKYVQTALECLKKSNVARSVRMIQKCRNHIGLFDGFWVHSSFHLPTAIEQQELLIDWMEQMHKTGYIRLEPKEALPTVGYDQRVQIDSVEQMHKTAGALWMYVHLCEKKAVLEHFERQGFNTMPLVWDVMKQSYRHPVGIALDNGNLVQIDRWIDQGYVQEQALLQMQINGIHAIGSQEVEIKSLAHALCAIPGHVMSMQIQKNPEPTKFERLVYGSGALSVRNNKGMNGLHVAVQLERWGVLERMLCVLMNREDTAAVHVLLEAQDAKQNTVQKLMEKKEKQSQGLLAQNPSYQKCVQYLKALQERQILGIESAKSVIQQQANGLVQSTGTVRKARGL